MILNINGISIDAQYTDQSVNTIFLPLLHRLSSLHTQKQTRILAMIAAPPGAGKTTLVSFLERIAPDMIPEKTVQAIGMDGFHRRQEYLLSHTICMDGKEIPMVQIKGAPVTFDMERLRNKTGEIRNGCKWPRYDRLLHNPVEDAVSVDADIVILEGNYLLLDEEGWRDLSLYADYTVSITAGEELLRERLISRRIATGVKREDAEAFVDFSDMANVRLCIEKMKPAELQLEILKDNDIIRRA